MKTLLDDFENIAARINKRLDLITVIAIICFICNFIIAFAGFFVSFIIGGLITLSTMWFGGIAMIGHMYGQTTIINSKCQYSRIGKMRTAPAGMQTYQVLFTAMWFMFLIVFTIGYLIYLFSWILST
jgi:hypothetical protein